MAPGGNHVSQYTFKINTKGTEGVKRCITTSFGLISTNSNVISGHSMHLQLFPVYLLSIFVIGASGGSYITSSRQNSVSMIICQYTNRSIRLYASSQRNLKPCTKVPKVFTGLFRKHSLYNSSKLGAVPEKRKSCTISDTDLSHVKNWFTLNLPEGVCVGVTTTAKYQSKDSDLPEFLPLSSALHDEEYDWGQENMISDASRTSFYLGRISLRSSLHKMLTKDNNKETEGIWEQLYNNPIRKDSFGRPILPNIVLGSISHKCGFAVGLSRLRYDDASCFKIDNKSIGMRWREDCRIFPEEEDESTSLHNSNLTNHSSVVGIGVDIERIHDDRSRRIQRKILTERERDELGALKVTSCSLLIIFFIYP